MVNGCDSKVWALRGPEFTTNYLLIAIAKKYVYWLLIYLIILCVAHASVMKNAYNLIALQYW